MQRKFILNIVFLLTVNLLIKPFFIFGIDRSIQNAVGAADYGLYFTLFNFSSLFQIVVDFGIQNFNNRNIAQHNHLLSKYFSHLSLLKILLSGIYGVVVLLAALVVGYRGTALVLLFGIVINQILLSFILFFRSNISGLQEYFTDSLLSVVDRLLLIGVCGYLLWFAPVGNFRIEWLVYTQLLVYGITAFIAFLLVFRRLEGFRFRWNLPFQLFLLRGSLPYALSFFLMSVYTRLDTVMIERMLPNGAFEAGQYASAYRLLDASNMIGYLFASLLMPMFAKLIQEKTPVLSITRFSFQTIWVIAGTVSPICFVFRKPIMELLYHHNTAYSNDLLGWLMLSFPAVCTMYIFGCLLSANNSMRASNWLYATGGIVNICLNLILLPKYGALGAAWATLATQIVIALGLVILAKQIFGWRTDWLFLAKIGGFFLLNCAVFSLLMQYGDENWLLNIVIGGFCSLVFALVFRLLDWRAALLLRTGGLEK